LAKDWECLNRTSRIFLRWASIRLMLRKLCHARIDSHGVFSVKQNLQLHCELFLLATDPKLEPFLNAANRAHINAHSVGLPSTRTMIPHSRGHGLKVGWDPSL
jgi:hypothetical protein